MMSRQDAESDCEPEERQRPADDQQAPEERPPEREGGARLEEGAGPQERIRTLAAERDDYLGRLQRAVADSQNLLKRLERVRQEADRNAVKSVVLSVLPLADSFARALAASDRAEGVEELREGLRLIEREFYSILAKLGVEPIDAIGEIFDPHYHHAVFQQPVEGADPNTVVGELKRGFMMGDEVIRASEVAVAAPPAQAGQIELDPGAAAGTG